MSCRLFSAADEVDDSGKARKRAEADERAAPGKESPAEGWLEEHIGSEIFPEGGNDSRGKSSAEERGVEQSRGGPTE